MIPAERRGEILRIVNERGKISVTEISDRFEVSEMTARRDLRAMDQEGLLRRVHGGAVSRLGRSYEPPYPTRTTKNVEAKRRIGRAAAGLVVDGDSLALDIGTTTLEVARALQGRHNLTIVTTSLPIANELVSRFSLENDIRLILTGGIVRARELSMVGHLAERAFSELRVDKAFFGIGGLNFQSGLTEYNIEDALVKRPLFEAAKMRIVVADGTKLGRTTFVKIAPLEEIDLLITDAEAPTHFLHELETHGIDVLVADADGP